MININNKFKMNKIKYVIDFVDILKEYNIYSRIKIQFK